MVRFVPVLPPAALSVWAVLSWTRIVGGLDLLAGGDRDWLVAALVLTGAGYALGAVAQQGAVLQRLPWRPLVAVQVAAALANHFSPVSTGGGLVNIKFLRRQGLSRSQAIAGAALNSAATAITHGFVLVVLVVVAPHALRQFPVDGTLVAAIAAVLVVAAVVACVAHRRRRPRVEPNASRWRGTIRDVLAVSRHRTRALQLWGAAIATPLMHGAVLVCVERAIGVKVSVGATLVVYLAASAVSGVVPAPGGFGALDVTLGIALARLVGDPSTAVAVVIGYRMCTTWLPLVPSAITMAVLLRRRVL